MTLRIRRTTIAELEACPNIHDLLEEYAAESSVPGLPAPRAKVELYRQIESGGAIQMIAAVIDGDGIQTLVGFAAVINTVLPHYGVVVSVMESLFVSKKHRSSGAGLGLIRAAEKIAESVGSPGLLISAPAGGVLEKVMPGVGYVNTNTAWFKKLSEGAVTLGALAAETETVGGVC